MRNDRSLQTRTALRWVKVFGRFGPRTGVAAFFPDARTNPFQGAEQTNVERMSYHPPGILGKGELESGKSWVRTKEKEAGHPPT